MKMGMQNSTTELLNLKEVIQSRIILKLKGNLKELDKTTSKDKFQKKKTDKKEIFRKCMTPSKDVTPSKFSSS